MLNIWWTGRKLIVFNYLALVRCVSFNKKITIMLNFFFFFYSISSTSLTATELQFANWLALELVESTSRVRHIKYSYIYAHGYEYPLCKEDLNIAKHARWILATILHADIRIIRRAGGNACGGFYRYSISNRVRFRTRWFPYHFYLNFRFPLEKIWTKEQIRWDLKTLFQSFLSQQERKTQSGEIILCVSSS